MEHQYLQVERKEDHLDGLPKIVEAWKAYVEERFPDGAPESVYLDHRASFFLGAAFFVEVLGVMESEVVSDPENIIPCMRRMRRYRRELEGFEESLRVDAGAVG